MKYLIFGLIALSYFGITSCSSKKNEQLKRPNILFAIADDQSFAHTSFAGAKFLQTPAFDSIAKKGVYFSNCIAGSPGCAPSRSTIVTGRYHWQNEQSGQHASSWMKKYVPFVDLLETNGYATGLTGKGVAPFQYARNENDSLWRETNAAGIVHSNIRYENKTPEDERTAGGIGPVNYFENFKYFIENVRQNKPFFFWYGSNEPHRSYELDSWKRNNKNREEIEEVPGFFPDNEVIRGDMLDYAVEIEWFDLHLQRMLKYLEDIGELENTIVIVTADNGMPFPRAKANGYDYGIHVPMAICFPDGFPGGRIVDDPVSFADLAPTILEVTKTNSEGMLPISGKSMLDILQSNEQGVVDPLKRYVFSGRERHSSSRYLNWGYPQRMIRSKDFLYIWNIKPERWPAGAPQRIKPDTKDELLPIFGIDENGLHHSDWAYTDIDAAPTKSYIVEHHKEPEIKPYFDWAVAKRPEVEFFDVKNDPYCLNNLAGDPDYAGIEKEMKDALMNELRKSEDPRVVGPDKEVFDSYLRYSPMREFPKPEGME
ncbi:sulfatase-like hydrolase/transferase [Maribellus comscasis]|uniref:Sulfatase-like hydrolase/transferase n=1 Tax=Maribellus comscasis TaxID=2681766 RepID=A0A6I6JYZ8_9BACT|nr:sulfatase [Maribellus comscasis]QGY45422.1 sulfatase-like hydrolase/transferase [Maribellus comscasis]